MRAGSKGGEQTRALVASLLLVSATAVATLAILAGTPVIPGCPCVYVETTAADGVNAIGPGASAIGALLIVALLSLFLSLVVIPATRTRVRESRPHVAPLETPRDLLRTRPLLALVRVAARKDRFSLGSSTSFAGITHSPV